MKNHRQYGGNHSFLTGTFNASLRVTNQTIDIIFEQHIFATFWVHKNMVNFRCITLTFVIISWCKIVCYVLFWYAQDG